MDLKVNKAMVSANETIYDGVQEQSIELDYVLPDYCPEIFKLIKCNVKPRIVSRNVSDDRVSYDLAVAITILYLTENSNALQCVKQKLNYTKSLEFGKSYENVSVRLCPKTDYVNCRAINPRRIDVRGAVGIKINVTADKKQEILTDALGSDIQLKKTQVKHAADKLHCEKQVVLSEDFEINSSKPPIQTIVTSDGSCLIEDKKVIANKVIAKGEAKVNILYTCEKDGKPSLEPLEVTIPYSQIIDVEGVDDNYKITCTPVLSDVSTTAAGGQDGGFKRIQIEVAFIILVKAFKDGVTEIITDAYSTSYPCDTANSKVKLDTPPLNVSGIAQFKSVINAEPDNQIAEVYDIWTNIDNANAVLDYVAKNVVVTGTIHNSVIAGNENGVPFTLEADEAFNYEIPFEGIPENSTVEIEVTPYNTSFTLNPDGSLSLKNEVKMQGDIYSFNEYSTVTDLDIDDTAKKEQSEDYALKIYYANQGEDLWDIAKRYGSSVESIIEENEDLDSDTLPTNTMLMIPIFV